MYRINFSLYRTTLNGNDRKRSHLFDARCGEAACHQTYSLKACHANCMHRRKCVVSKCEVVWKTAPFHDEKKLKKLFIFQNYSIPHRNEQKKKWILRYWFSGFNSKNKRDHMIKNTKVCDVVTTARSNDAQCSVAFLENKQRRIS